MDYSLAQVRHLHEVIACKDETIASKNNLIPTKDQGLNKKTEVIKSEGLMRACRLNAGRYAIFLRQA